MEANVTVHWFVHPLWFQDMGAFTKEENIEVFVEWARLAFTLFGALCSSTHAPAAKWPSRFKSLWQRDLDPVPCLLLR